MNIKYISILFIIFITGCEARVNCSSKQPIKQSIKLSEITCNEVIDLYDRCNGYNTITTFSQIKNCRDRYTPVLWKCYGVKQ